MPRAWINICAINMASNKLLPSFKQICHETLVPPEVVLFPPEVVVLAAEVQVAVVARLLLIHRALPVAQGTLVRNPTSWAPTAM